MPSISVFLHFKFFLIFSVVGVLGQHGPSPATRAFANTAHMTQQAGIYQRVLQSVQETRYGQTVDSPYNPARVLADSSAQADIKTEMNIPDSAYVPISRRRLQNQPHFRSSAAPFGLNSLYKPANQHDQQSLQDDLTVIVPPFTSSNQVVLRNLQQNPPVGSASDNLLHELMISTLRSEQGRAVTAKILNRLGLDADAIDLDALLDNPQVQEQARRVMQDEDLRNLIFSILFASNSEDLEAKIDALINMVVSMASN